jgi:hypothetical protein
MPQWSRDQAELRARYPDERWVSRCVPSDAELLLRYDHHVVWIGGRPALLLTYAWAALGLEAHDEPLAFEVSFTYAPWHPAAPKTVQAIIDRLIFTPVESRDTEH